MTRLKYDWLLLGGTLALLSGCANTVASTNGHNDDVSTTPSLPSLALHKKSQPFNDIDVNVFSTYLSEASQQACQTANQHHTPCTNDVIAPQQFLSALTDSALFRELSPSANQFDYELLIGNQASAAYEQQHVFTEITLVWRGVELDTWQQAASTDAHLTDADKASAIVNQWGEYAHQQSLFSADFLYKQLGASNYIKELQLPASIGEFQQTGIQLYPDPFKGAIVRYLHPEYEEAILDISVYPILDSANGNAEQLLLQELKKEQQDAAHIAKTRGMTLFVDTPVSRFPLHNEQMGAVLAMHAEKPDNESLFATIYLFKQEDKFIKLSTTFPERVGDELVRNALPQIQVPRESPLMAQIRNLSSPK